jgi:hypothetical protein
MSRYFLHLRDGTDEVLDEDGVESGTMDSLRKTVLTNARGVMAGDIRNGILDFRFRIDAEDDGGVIVYSLPFKHAVNVIPETTFAGSGANDA